MKYIIFVLKSTNFRHFKVYVEKKTKIFYNKKEGRNKNDN